jgi:hypothetical protein
MCFDVENEGICKMFQECHTRDCFIKNTKGIYFLGIFIGFYFSIILQMPTYLMSSIDNWLNQFWFSYEFLKSKSWSLKRPLMSKTQMITPFVILMTSLDHSLVHVLNKQEKISNV